MSDESKTVEVVGWLLVDENGFYELVGFTGHERENVEQSLCESIVGHGVSAVMYELRITVPRPSRVLLSLNVRELAPTPPMITGSAKIIPPSVISVASGSGSSGRGTEPEIDEEPEDVPSVSSVAESSAALNGPGPPSAPSVAKSSATSNGWAEKAIAFLKQRASGAPAQKLAEAAGVAPERIVKLCQDDNRFLVRPQGRGHRIQLASQPRF